jgi:hypothetical protein
MNMTKNKIIPIIAGLILLWPSIPAVHAGSSGFVLASANRTVNTGTVFGIPIKVFPNGASIDTARVVLNFDPSVVAATQFKFSSNLDTEAPASFIDNQKGIISWGGFDMEHRIESPAVFGLATFKAVGPGNGRIALAQSSKLISGGEDVADANSYNAVEITVVPTAPVPSQKISQAVEQPPEYQYRLIPNSRLCQPIPALCHTRLGDSLVSIILLFLVILILVLFFRPKTQ